MALIGCVEFEPITNLIDIVLFDPDPTEFPETYPIPSTKSENRYYFNNAANGILGNGDWKSQVIGGDPADFLPNTTYTSFPVGSSVRTNDAISISGNVIRQRFTYTGLPLLNKDFGNKEVTMNCTSPVSTTQTAFTQVFFMKNPNNHTGTYAQNLHTSKTPNWFYYWSQTKAGDTAKYDYWYGGASGGAAGRAVDWTGNGDWRSIIYLGAAGSSGVGDLRTGIDLFAAVVRHEDHHLVDFNAWWPNGYDPSLDNDETSNTGDMIPDSLEATLTHSGTPAEPYSTHAEFYDSGLAATHIDHFNYGVYSGWNDSEDHAHHWNDKWVNGTADREDWAKPGKQWK